MTSKFVMDSYAWVEYFRGSAIGSKVRSIIESEGNEVYTNVVTVAEIVSVLKRLDLDHNEGFKTVLRLSRISSIDVPFAREVGELHATSKRSIKGIGLADIFVLLAARRLGAKVLTGDPHFKGFKEAMML